MKPTFGKLYISKAICEISWPCINLIFSQLFPHNFALVFRLGINAAKFISIAKYINMQYFTALLSSVAAKWTPLQVLNLACLDGKRNTSCQSLAHFLIAFPFVFVDEALRFVDRHLPIRFTVESLNFSHNQSHGHSCKHESTVTFLREMIEALFPQYANF